MKKTSVALVAFFSLFVGAAGASMYWLKSSAQYMNDELVTRTKAGIEANTALLQALREGRTGDATKQLDTALDGELLTASGMAQMHIEFSPELRAAIARERESRRTTGYQPASDKVRQGLEVAYGRLAP